MVRNETKRAVEDQSTIASPDPLTKISMATLALRVIKTTPRTIGDTGADWSAVNAGFGRRATSAATASLLAVSTPVTRQCEPLQ